MSDVVAAFFPDAPATTAAALFRCNDSFHWHLQHLIHRFSLLFCLNCCRFRCVQLLLDDS